MSQNPNDNAANSPANFPPGQLPAFPGSPTTAPPPGGLKSTLKIAVPLVALVGVVFGVTYLGMYTPPKSTDGEKDKGQVNSGEPPLRFFTSGRYWDPPKLSAPGYAHFPMLAPSKAVSPDGETTASYSLQDRLFQGFYEPGDENSPLRRTQFWFENRNDRPVTMTLRGVSCTACSGARLAAIPPETTAQLLQHTAVASLPLGAFNGFGVGLVQPAASLTQLTWAEKMFKDDNHAQYSVPAATNPDKWSPQWGILELTFRVGPNPSTPLRAFFSTQVEGGQSGENTFAIMFEAASGLEVSRSVIDVGEIGPLTVDSTHEFIVYSSTRGPGSEFGDLGNPSCLVQAPLGVSDPVKFVEVTKIERIPDADLMAVAEGLKKFTQVRAAYRVTVAVRPKVGESRMDLGQLERHIAVSIPGVNVSRTVTVRALVRGAVWVDNHPSEVVVKSHTGGAGTTAWVDLTTEKPGMELAVVKDECELVQKQHRARFDFDVVKQPDRGGQGYYKLKIAVAPGVFGDFSGTVVLEVKGPNPQRIRIPFRGHGGLQ